MTSIAEASILTRARSTPSPATAYCGCDCAKELTIMTNPSKYFRASIISYKMQSDGKLCWRLSVSLTSTRFDMAKGNHMRASKGTPRIPFHGFRQR